MQNDPPPLLLEILRALEQEETTRMSDLQISRGEVPVSLNRWTHTAVSGKLR